MPAIAPSAPSTGRRLPGLDGVRGLAALAVVADHVWLYGATSGDPPASDWRGVVAANFAIGLTAFFALSGFLLWSPFAGAALRGRPGPLLGAYARNRALRIFPAYWTALLVLCVVLPLAWRADGELGRLDDPLAILSALTFAGSLTDAGLPISQAWSLAVEAVFYALLPLLGFFAARAAGRLGRRTAVVIPALVLLGVGLVTRLSLMKLAPGHLSDSLASIIEWSFLGQADLFAFGMLVAVVRVEVLDGRLALSRWWRPSCLGAGLSLVVAGGIGLGTELQFSMSPWNTVSALGVALLLALVVLPAPDGRPSRSARALEWRPVLLLGVISYGIYLWHMAPIDWMAWHGQGREGQLGFLVNLAVVLAITIPVATLSYRVIERPALRLKLPMRRRPEPVQPPAPAQATARIRVTR